MLPLLVEGGRADDVDGVLARDRVVAIFLLVMVLGRSSLGSMSMSMSIDIGGMIRFATAAFILPRSDPRVVRADCLSIACHIGNDMRTFLTRFTRIRTRVHGRSKQMTYVVMCHAIWIS